MMASLSGLVVLALAAALQSAVAAQIHLLQGTADLVLLTLAAWYLHEDTPGSWVWVVLAALMVGALSALPWWLYLAGYTLVAGLARLLRRRLWRASFFAYFTVVLLGSLSVQSLALAYLMLIRHTAIALNDAFNLVILPGLLLNLLLALPIHSVIDEWTTWIAPAEEEA